jgi:hypothetical protein
MAVDQDRTARARKTASDFEARCMNVIGAKREFGVLNCTFDKNVGNHSRGSSKKTL